jgi:hypothetical protein
MLNVYTPLIIDVVFGSPTAVANESTKISLLTGVRDGDVTVASNEPSLTLLRESYPEISEFAEWRRYRAPEYGPMLPVDPCCP